MLRGYDRRQVDAFLQRCAGSVGPVLAAFPELAPYAGPGAAVEPVTARDVRDVRFALVLRGYDLSEVDAVLRRVVAALGEPPTPRWEGDPLPPVEGPGPELPGAVRGYDREAVDAFLVRCAHSLGARVGQVPELAALTGQPRTGEPLSARDVERAQFRMVLRGYTPDPVDVLLDRVQRVLSG